MPGSRDPFGRPDSPGVPDSAAPSRRPCIPPAVRPKKYRSDRASPIHAQSPQSSDNVTVWFHSIFAIFAPSAGSRYSQQIVLRLTRSVPLASQPLELALDVVPRARFDMLDLRGRLSAQERDALDPYPKCVCWSSHTTAGFLDRSVASRLGPNEGIAAYVDAFRTIFPEGADYEHDRLERRHPLEAVSAPCARVRRVGIQVTDDHGTTAN